MSGPRFSLFDDLHAELDQDPGLEALCAQTQNGTDNWLMLDGLLLKKHRVFVPPSSALITTVIIEAHGTGHEVLGWEWPDGQSEATNKITAVYLRSVSLKILRTSG
ncbi:hypothetical protein U9M48_028078 [Paspalum notatum var. saurae]|uniref:Uncharacterized protein n=1 Tax=Paspalum notatum var. saurae TaxID=547442 RepID=A0AAQ3TXM7_PASNO